MRVPVSCLSCLNDMFVGRVPWAEQKQTLLELRDDGAYLGTCPEGHPISFAIHWLRYEMLYEAGAVALLCGFQREAIGSMASALERFYEFATLVLSEHHRVTAAEVEAAWKPLATSSERQLGAFLFLYLVSFRRPFDGTVQKMVELRNDVVHKGRIPTREQTVAYAEYVFAVIHRVRAELEEVAADAVNAVRQRTISVHAQKLEQRQKAERPAADARSNAIRGGTMLGSWLNDWRHEGDFVWHLEALAYRVRHAGAGTVIYPETFTRFDPNEGTDGLTDEERGHTDGDQWDEPPGPEDCDDPS